MPQPEEKSFLHAEDEDGGVIYFSHSQSQRQKRAHGTIFLHIAFMLLCAAISAVVIRLNFDRCLVSKSFNSKDPTFIEFMKEKLLSFLPRSRAQPLHHLQSAAVPENA